MIYAMNTPVITGIGHEIDFTIADFTADFRANTPTGAVEASTPDIHEVHQALENRLARMQAVVNKRMSVARQRYERSAAHPVMNYPERLISDQSMRLDYVRERLMKGADSVTYARSSFNDLAARLSHDMNAYTRQLHADIIENRMRMNHALSAEMSNEHNRLDALQKALLNNAAHGNEIARTRIARNSALLDAYSPLKVLGRGYGIVMHDEKSVRSVHDVNTGEEIVVRLADGRLRAGITGKEVTDEH
jgi:exodeoxyribonuclease VII large subunit